MLCVLSYVVFKIWVWAHATQNCPYDLFAGLETFLYQNIMLPILV